MMFLLMADGNPTSLGGAGSGAAYKGVYDAAKEAWEAVKKTTDPILGLQAAVKGIIEMQDISLKKQREITQGVVINAEAFQKMIGDAYLNVEDLGVNFSEVAAAAGETSKALGRAVIPSQTLLEDQIKYSKATGVAVADLVKSEATLMRLYSSQEESFKKIQEITNEAQKLGLDVKKVVEDVTTNLNNLQKFKMDSAGLTEMATQAASLRTNIEGIGAMKLAETLWDPGKAIELSQKMQMYGGQVGKLGDAFQLMRMGAYDAKGLQDAMLDVYEQAFKIDEKGNILNPGQMEIQQLKAYSEAMGSNLNTAMEIGRERVKQSFIEEKIAKLASNKFTDDQLQFIKSVGEIKDGKISMNIPGVGEIKDVTQATTAQMKAINDYQLKAGMDEKSVAITNLTVAEDTLQSIRDIEEYLIRGQISKTAAEQTAVLNGIKGNLEATVGLNSRVGENSATQFQKDVVPKDIYNSLISSVDIGTLIGLSDTDKQNMQIKARDPKVYSGTPSTEFPDDYMITDAPFENNTLITGDKGTISKMIFDKEDDFLAAPRLNEILNKAKLSFDTAYALNDMSSSPLPMQTKTPGETFAKVETTVNTNNTTEVKFSPIVIEVKGVDGTLKQMLEKGDNATLLTDKIREEFSKMPKIMGEKGVFGY
jgi:hypothetical protein